MNLTRCRSALIYLNENDLSPLCEVAVTNLIENTATLIIDDDVVDSLNSEMDITFLDENLGLVGYKCFLSAPKKFLSDDGKWLNSVECELVSIVSATQRREDFKIKADLVVSAIIPKEMEIPKDFTNYTSQFGINSVKGKSINISAGGIFFVCDFKFYKDSCIDIYISLSNGHKLRVSVDILRREDIVNKDGSTSYGYGCKYTKLSSGIESTIRNFVFQKQRENRR